MTIKSIKKAGLEAVDFIHSSSFFDEIINEIKSLRYLTDDFKKVPAGLFNNSNLEAIIKKYTKLTIKITLVPSSYAFLVYPGHINPETIMHRHGSANIDVATQKEMKSVILNNLKLIINQRSKNATSEIGWIDRKTGFAGGIFTKSVSELFIGSAMLLLPFTDEELAGGILHEIGHVVTAFEYSSRMMTANLALLSCKEAFLSGDTKIYFDVVKSLEKSYGINLTSIYSNTDETFSQIELEIEKKIIEVDTSELGSPIYDYTSTEFLADQYAVRYGAGRAAAQFVDKINSWTNSKANRSNLNFILSEIANMSFAMVKGVLSLGYTFYIAYNNIPYAYTDRYDTTKDRFIRIRNEMINALKDRNLPNTVKQKYVTDIEIQNQLIEEYDDYQSFYQKIAYVLNPFVRDQVKKKKMQQQLEALSSNPLYLQAAKLNLLNKD